MQKKLTLITLTFLLTMIICGAASAAPVSSASTSTTLTFSENPTYEGHSVTLTAHLTSGGVPLSGRTIAFNINGYTVYRTTNSNGDASYTYTPTSSGNKNIQASFAGSPGYQSSSDSKVLNVAEAHSTDTELTLTHINTNADNQITLKARLTSGGHPLAGQTITFSVIGGSTIGTATTDSNGYATISYTASSNVDVRASFAGAYVGTSNYYRSSSDTDDLDVYGTSTSLTVNPTTTGVGNSVTLKSRLTASGNGINDQTIHFLVDGVEVGTATTDWYKTGPNWWDWEQGWASITYTPTTPGFKNVQAIFNGKLYSDWSDWDYLKSSASSIQTLTVTAPTCLTVQPASGYKDHTTTLSAKLTSGGNGVECKTIKFFINGNYVGSGITDANGVATFDYTILQGVGCYPGYVTACFEGTTIYLPSSGANDLTVNAIPTSLKVDDITGNKGKTVNLKATLTNTLDNVGIEGKTVLFKVNGVDAGTATTDANGVATLPYLISLVGGTYDITAEFAADDKYAYASGTGKLKVNQSSIYVLTTVSKNNPTVGETIKITFKLGNKGPDAADNVVFTYKIPEGLEFVSLETEPGYPQAVYDPATRTVTWTLGTVPILDPWLNLNVKVLKAGSFVIDPSVTTDTYDTALPASVQFASVNAVEVVKAASNTVPMQKTGIPVAMLVLAILAVLGGFIAPKRK